MGFYGQDKITLYMIFVIYTEIIVSLFMIPFWGFGVSLGIIGLTTPITLIARKYYDLANDKKLNDEIGRTTFWSGLYINRKGIWQYIDFGIADKEEIVVTDEELERYQKESQFNNAVESIKQDPNNLEYAEIIEKSTPHDQYVDQELAGAYQTLGICTSRQIYAFEMLRAYYEIDDKSLDLMIDKVSKIKDTEKDKLDKMNGFERIIYFILKNQGIELRNTTTTNFLEKCVKDLGVSDKILYNTEMYGRNLVRLHDVEYLYRDQKEEKQMITKNLLPTIIGIISLLFSIILIAYVKGSVIPYLLSKKTLSSSLEIGMWTLYILAIIPIIVSFIISFWRIKYTNDEYKRPNRVIFKNMMSKRFSFDNYCELRSQLREFSSDARIYKIRPMEYYRKQIWNENDNEYIIVVLPSSYEDSLEFDKGRVPYKGYNVSVQITPVVLLDIGTIMGNIPLYIMVSCTYHFKRLTKIYYTTKLAERWLCKVYQYFIAKLQTRIQILEPENDSLKIALKQWQEWSVQQAQSVSEGREIRHNELLKIKPQSMDEQSQQQEQPQQPQQPSEEMQQQYQLVMANLKKRNMLVIILVIAIFVILFVLLFGFIIPSSSSSNISKNSKSTTTTTETLLWMIRNLKLLR